MVTEGKTLSRSKAGGLDSGWQISALADAVNRISELARQGQLAEPVAHLPRWKVRDVVAHLGGVHRWATRIVAKRSMAGPGFKKSKLDGDELCDWFDEGVEALLDMLTSTGLDEPCPNFNPGSVGTVAWWARRQAHESTVHRWDVEQALGSTTAIPAPIAADAIDEFLDVFVRTRGKQTLTSPLVLATTRPARTWTLTPAEKPGRIDVAAGTLDLDVPAATVSGKPEALLLALWGRQSATDAGLTIDGEAATAEHLMAI